MDIRIRAVTLSTEGIKTDKEISSSLVKWNLIIMKATVVLVGSDKILPN